MKVLMYQPQFAPLVECLVKRNTIRPERKRPIRRGDVLSHREWMGKPYRSGQRVLLVEICQAAEPIRMRMSRQGMLTIKVAGKVLPADRWNGFAKADGFEGIKDLVEWFKKTHGLPFQGTLIKW